jgi:pSer/pThr/pTyr-binding forkhead associated (FHA) protein
MKVQLIVVQGKPEGKIIPLLIPTFRIGRGENCHLRPNSEQVSREHAELSITADKVVIRDLGSRNGTLVNHQLLTAPRTLKDRDLIEIGALTFAISIQGAPVPASTKVPEVPQAAKASPDDVSNAEIESWLIADASSPTPNRSSGVYKGETKTYDTNPGGTPPNPGTTNGSRGGHEPPPDVDEAEAETETQDDEAISPGETAEFPLDESNPFSRKTQPSPLKPAQRDSSDAASEILKRLLERRRVPH